MTRKTSNPRQEKRSKRILCTNVYKAIFFTPYYVAVLLLTFNRLNEGSKGDDSNKA